MAKSAKNPRYWNARRFAERWDVDPSTVYLWMKDGTIPPEAVKRGPNGIRRIDVELCERIWAERREPGRPPKRDVPAVVGEPA